MTSKKKQTTKSMGKIVPHGWVHELSEAKDVAEKNRSAAVYMRVAIARQKLRQWSKCKVAAEIGLALKPEKKVKRQLKWLQSCANQELAKGAGRKAPGEELKNILKETDIDSFSVGNLGSLMINLNYLQSLAVVGRLESVEEAVALGAAINLKVPPEKMTLTAKNAKIPSPPTGSTPLLLTFLFLLAGKCGSYGCPLPLEEGIPPEEMEERETVAVRLVEYGADWKVSFSKPDILPPGKSFHHWLHHLDVYGKNCKELAVMTQSYRLLEAIEKMETKEDVLANALCRCGSRLPWGQCHGGGINEHAFFLEEEDGSIAFRYSPMAPCPCRENEKTYFRCCWRVIADPHYQNDSNAQITQTMTVTRGDNPARDAIYERMSEYTEEDYKEYQKVALDPVKRRKAMADLVRCDGMEYVAAYAGPKSKLATWDPNVYAGCVERLPKGNHFYDVHWTVPKGQLLDQCNDWNVALEKYCNDMGIFGQERDAIVQKHTASPLAPCANPPCDSMEEKVKGFMLCGRCKRVAYCSVACQRAHWKAHKSFCG